MKILGIESASLTASCALIDGEKILAEFTTNYKKTHSETLLPMIADCLKMVEETMENVDAVAVSVGPGSFTGLRIGVSTVKGLAYAAGKPVVAVPTLDAMAYGSFGSEFLLCPIMDARRGEVYTGLYSFDGEVFLVHESATACPITEQVEKAKETAEKLNKRVCFLGDGVTVFRKQIEELFPEAAFAPAPLLLQRGSAVAALGAEMYKKGEVTDAMSLTPLYLRESQAERERREAGLSTEPAEI